MQVKAMPPQSFRLIKATGEEDARQRYTHMKIAGIDLSGPRNYAETCLVSFEERGEEIHLIDVRGGADNDQILEAISSLGQKERIVIGIDAPLSYNPKGGDRP